jgi:hypothetical protein
MCVDLLSVVLILHFFAQLSIVLMVARGSIEASAGPSCVAKIAVSSAKVAAVVLSDVERSLV